MCSDENRVNMVSNSQNNSTPGNVGMRTLIPIVNKMQDICTQMGTNVQFDLPQIAVVGSQSAGKSSVLESFVGRDFLPRGTGIVTRRPLILQLVNGPEEFGEFAHCKDRKFVNFADIRAEIVAETERKSGSNKGLSNVPINLCIHSPSVLNLTLVDLPGVTRNPIGDQPADIETQVREMILEYIQQENCLILAVSAANVDLAISDGLKLAREVDKDGSRTIGVITKLDLMDKGTDARDIFENKQFPLRRGYVGVVCRSQKDIDNQKDIATALKDEHNFFMRHSYYRNIIDRLGIPHLQQVLNLQLTEHIRKTLPGLQDKLRKQLVTLEKDVTDFKLSHPDDPVILKKVLVDSLQQLQLDFQKEIGTLGAKLIDTTRLSSGAKIKRIFHERLPEEISKIEKNSDMQREINYAIENLHGIQVGLYPPLMAFQVLVRKQISQLEQPIVLCVDLVIEELSNAVRTCTQRITNYPRFRDEIENKIVSFIHGNSLIYQKNILSLVEMESAYMNTKHEEFVNQQKKKRNTNKSKVNGVELATGIITNPAGTAQRVTVDVAKEVITNGNSDDDSDSDSNENISTANTSKGIAAQNKAIHKGLLHIKNIEIEDENGSSETGDPFWFVLSSETLSCYKAPNESEQVFEIPLNGIEFRDTGESNNHVITLFHSDGQNVHPNYKELELSCKSSGKFHAWRDSFLQAISSKENDPKPNQSMKEDVSPPHADVQDIYKKVNSYMNIVKKTIRDMVPKAMTLYIINNLEKFINTELLMQILDAPKNGYMEMFAADAENTERYEETKRMHQTCEKALQEIIHI